MLKEFAEGVRPVREPQSLGLGP